MTNNKSIKLEINSSTTFRIDREEYTYSLTITAWKCAIFPVKGGFCGHNQIYTPLTLQHNCTKIEVPAYNLWLDQAVTLSRRRANNVNILNIHTYLVTKVATIIARTWDRVGLIQDFFSAIFRPIAFNTLAEQWVFWAFSWVFLGQNEPNDVIIIILVWLHPWDF